METHIEATYESEQSAVSHESAPIAEEIPIVSNTTKNLSSSSKRIIVKVKVIEQSIGTDNIVFEDLTARKYGVSQYGTLILFVAMFTLILVLVLIRRAVEKYLNDILISRLNSIMKDTIIIVVTTTLILYLDFIEVFDRRLDVSTICFLFLIFAFFWLAISTLLILIGQSFCVKWEENEILVKQQGKSFVNLIRLPSILSH